MKNVILYGYSPDKPGFNIEYKDSGDRDLARLVLSYDSPYSTGIKQNDTVIAEIFAKKETVEEYSHEAGKAEYPLSAISGKTGKIFKNPAGIIILVHGFSTSSGRTGNYYYFAKWMALHDTPCIFINLPFHLHRTPAGERSGERLIYYDDVETLEFFHQSVVDIKKLLDILDLISSPSGIYICGISLGSMVSVIIMALEKRIEKGVFLIGGGNWEEVHWKGVLRYILKGNCTKKAVTTRQDCHKIYKNFPCFLDVFKNIKDGPDITFSLEDYPELKETVSKYCFLCDPVAFAHRLDREKVLLINSKIDLYFSKRSTLQLWEAIGKPRIIWLNSMHSSKILTRDRIINEISDFINSKVCKKSDW